MIRNTSLHPIILLHRKHSLLLEANGTVISMKLLYTCQIFVIGPVWDGIVEYINL